jgi:hypothetical protein
MTGILSPIHGCKEPKLYSSPWVGRDDRRVQLASATKDCVIRGTQSSKLSSSMTLDVA